MVDIPYCITNLSITYSYITSNISFTNFSSFSSKTVILLFFALNLGSGYRITFSGVSYSKSPAASLKNRRVYITDYKNPH